MYFDTTRALPPATALMFAREAVRSGLVDTACSHFKKRLGERRMSVEDCLNIIARGRCLKPQFRNGEWRYRIETKSMWTAVEFAHDGALVFVCAGRKDP